MKVLGINAVFHDSAAALVVDGQIVAAAEEERFSRRKHGKRPLPFSTWELPELSARWCLQQGGLQAAELDAVAYSYDPKLARNGHKAITDAGWEPLRTLYAERAPLFLQTALPGLDAEKVRFVAHHVAHAASAYLAAPFDSCAVMVLDGRGERASYLAGRADRKAGLEVLETQELPHSLGLLYEEVTDHLGFLRSSDEYKVMALAAYGRPRWLRLLRDAIRVVEGGFRVTPLDWVELAPRLEDGEEWTPDMHDHADLAASVQARLEEVLVELAGRLHETTREDRLVLAGGVALNCVANARIAREGAFDEVWAQPASGDSGSALGAALQLALEAGDEVAPMSGADLGRGFSDAQIEAALQLARVPYEKPDDVAEAAAGVIADDGVVAWFQGRSEFGPRALGHRSLLANPGRRENLARLNDIKGREKFRPVAPMVLAERAAEIFDGQLPSACMLFTHRVRQGWRERIPAVVHVDGSARIQTVDRTREPLVASLLEAFERRNGLPVLVNTSLNTAGRPMVDDVRDALECFGSAPIDALAIGPFLVRRAA